MKLVLCRVQTRPLPLVSGTRYICKLILTGEQGVRSAASPVEWEITTDSKPGLLAASLIGRDTRVVGSRRLTIVGVILTPDPLLRLVFHPALAPPPSHPSALTSAEAGLLPSGPGALMSVQWTRHLGSGIRPSRPRAVQGGPQGISVGGGEVRCPGPRTLKTGTGTNPGRTYCCVVQSPSEQNAMTSGGLQGSGSNRPAWTKLLKLLVQCLLRSLDRHSGLWRIWTLPQKSEAFKMTGHGKD